jgi:hypothetical protein
MSVLKTATDCWRQAAEAEMQAAQITDEHLKAVYLRIAHQWSALARSYEFADSAEQFLLDAKRTKDANSRQPSGELVHLPSSLASRAARSRSRLARALVATSDENSRFVAASSGGRSQDKPGNDQKRGGRRSKFAAGSGARFNTGARSTNSCED